MVMRPDNGTDPETRRRLTDLRNGLLTLHKVLLDSESGSYTRDVAPINSRGELLQLVMNDPWFGWLHDLSLLVVQIDETLDDKVPASRDDVERYIQKSRTLLTPAEEGTGFEKRYFEALQRDPDVILAHGAMMKTLSGLNK